MPTKGPAGSPPGTNNSMTQRNTVWRWQPEEGQYEDIAADLGLDSDGWTRTMVPADLDRDGFPEVLTWSLDRGLELHRSGCNENAWLRVSLRARGDNPQGIGAKIRAGIPGGINVTRHIASGSTGLMSSQPPEALLGLADADTVDIDVFWPDGSVSRNLDVPTRRAIVVTQP